MLGASQNLKSSPKGDTSVAPSPLLPRIGEEVRVVVSVLDACLPIEHLFVTRSSEFVTSGCYHGAKTPM